MTSKQYCNGNAMLFQPMDVFLLKHITKLEMWANAQRDGRLAKYRWRRLFNSAVCLCSNAAKTRNPLKFAAVHQTNETISAANRSKFTTL